MDLQTAIASDVFRSYCELIGILLLIAAVVIGLLKASGRDVSSIRATYTGWLIMVPIVLGTILLGRVAVIVGVGILALVGFKEFARATGLYEDWWLTGLVYLAIGALTGVSLTTDPRLATPGWYGMFMSTPVFVIAAILLVPILRNRSKGQLQLVSLAIVGFVYFGWMFCHLGFLTNSRDAYGYLLYLAFAVPLNDVAAFTFGRLFGKRKLRAAISPNKTVAGAVGAIGVSLILPWLLAFSFPHFGALQLVLTGLIVGVGGQLGDLVISYIKRDIGIKDMGAAIAGHGGVLDRIDSLIFVAPLFFHMVRWFHGL